PARGLGARVGVLALRALRPRSGVCEVSAPPRATLSGISPRISGGLSVIKVMWVAVVGGAGLLAGISVGAGWAQPKELPAQVVTLGGPAEVYKKGAPAWTPAGLRAELGEGDSVRTQVGGRITLKTASGQALRLGSRSQLAVLPAEVETGPTRVRLDNGWLWVAVSPNSPPPTQVEVRAGPGVVTVRGAGVGLRRAADGAV